MAEATAATTNAAQAPAIGFHDALAINALGAVLLDVDGLEGAEDMVGLLAAARPLIRRGDLRLGDLAKAIDAVLACWPARRAQPLAWARAEFDARMALVAVLRWRAAQAAERIWPGGRAP